MIAMRMSNQTCAYFVAIVTVFKKMRNGIGVKIDKNFAVYKRLRARANIFSATRTRILANFAITKPDSSRQVWCCRSLTLWRIKRVDQEFSNSLGYFFRKVDPGRVRQQGIQKAHTE